jgi:ubiquinone/menaquinone biosynthesis C-methylase UbiE
MDDAARDRLVPDPGRADRDRQLLAGAAGQVLEIGAGTGSNLRFYGPAVESLTLTEPETPMLRRLEHKAGEQAPGATVLRAPAEDLPFEDATFDVAVSTLVLCGVDDQPRALRELRRVLRPGGQLLFIEHVRSGDTRLARSQDRMNGINRFAVGCDCNRPTLKLVLLSRAPRTRRCRRSPSSSAQPLWAALRFLYRRGPWTRSPAEETGHDGRRRKVPPLSAPETIRCQSGRAGFSASAVMTRRTV